MTAPDPYTARTPEDLLALIPVVFGFEPSDSVVMLTVGSPTPFHARSDVPRDRAELSGVSDQLLTPARQHRACEVLLVLYTADAETAVWIGRRLLADFEATGIGVLDVLRADGERWFSPLWPRPGVGADGVAYDAGNHPFRARSVLEGRVTHPSRAALAATLAPVAEWTEACAEGLRLAPAPPQADEVTALLETGLGEGDLPPSDLARVLLAMRDLTLRDLALERIRRPEAERQLTFWRRLVRAAPEEYVPDPAALLAFTAWLAGDGALAWCAIDRCREVDPEHRLAALISQLLRHAVPPTSWERPAA